MKLRALVFDDEPIIREHLATLLERRGYEVFSYDRPGQCQFGAASADPCRTDVCCADVIVSDIQMPGENGLDFIERLKQQACQQPPVAIVSGSWTDNEVQRAARLGCRCFCKPIDVNELAEWLSTIEKRVDPERRLAHWASRVAA